MHRFATRRRATCAATAMFFAVGLSAPDHLCPRHAHGDEAPAAEEMAHHGHAMPSGHHQSPDHERHGEDHRCDCLTLCQVESGETANSVDVEGATFLLPIEAPSELAANDALPPARPPHLLPYPNPPPLLA